MACLHAPGMPAKAETPAESRMSGKDRTSVAYKKVKQ